VDLTVIIKKQHFYPYKETGFYNLKLFYNLNSSFFKRPVISECRTPAVVDGVVSGADGSGVVRATGALR